MYPADWHRTYGDKTGHSARAIMPHLVDIFAPESSVEIGCGNAHWTQAGVDLGVADYVVADGAWNDQAALLVDRDRFAEIDLRVPVDLGRRFDMAICLEVAEHVATPHSDTIVQSLCDLSDVIVFGAAIPLQGGYGHINEQWPSWWRDLFRERGYEPFDLVRPKFWRDADLHYWYRQNIYIYVNSANADASGRAALAERALPRHEVMFDAVHPEKYTEMVSYQAISLKRLVRRLPGWVVDRARSKLSGAG